MAEILAAVRRGDVDGMVRALPLAGGFVPHDDSDLRRELREVHGLCWVALYGANTPWRRSGTGASRPSVVEERGCTSKIAQLADFLVEAERLGGEGQTRIVTAAEAAEVIISRYRDPAYVAARRGAQGRPARRPRGLPAPGPRAPR